MPVTTANGAAMAAEVRRDSIEVGPIVMRNVRALVARPGALEESLLGMSFLERLKSYAVERGRLILTARVTMRTELPEMLTSPSQRSPRM